MRRSRRVVAAAAVVAALLVPPAGAAAVPVEELGDPPGTWWWDKLAVEEAHTKATGEGVTVAIVDSIVDPTVPELQGADVQPAFIACGQNTLDPLPPERAFGSGPATEHGTAMVSMVVGTGGSNGPAGQGPRGIAPDATVRVYAYTETGEEEEACPSDPGNDYGSLIYDAMEQAVADGVDIISLSANVGGVSLEPVLEAAAAKGIVVLASVGSPGEGGIGYPAMASDRYGVVAVTAVGPDAQVADYVARGRGVVVAAPGTGIMTGGFVDGAWLSEGLNDGSSAATALTAGALALVKSRYPQATGRQLVQHLIRNTTRDELTYDEAYGFGIVSLRKMLDNDPTVWQDVNPLMLVDRVSDVPELFPDEEALASAGPPAASAAPTAAASEPADAAGEPPGAADQQPPVGDGGVPRWGWPVLLVLVLVAGGGLVVVRRRGARGSAGADEPDVAVSGSRAGGS